jgi:hypothetical protein
MSVLLIIFLVLAGFLAWTAISGAPWVPVRRFDVKQLLDDAGVSQGTYYVELGSGDGRLLKAAARRGAKVVGYELNPLLWLISWCRTLGYKNCTVRLADFWRADLAQADVVMAFLVPRTMPKLDSKAAKEMKPTAQLISYIFAIPGKKPLKRGKSWLIYDYPHTKSPTH